MLISGNEVRVTVEEVLLRFYLCCLRCREFLEKERKNVERVPAPNGEPPVYVVLIFHVPIIHPQGLYQYYRSVFVYVICKVCL